VARKPNYGFEKRRKELERKQKREDKALRKRESTAPPAPEAEPPVEGPLAPAAEMEEGRPPQ